MPIRLIPTHSDPESDLETQLAVLGAVIVGNLLAVSVLCASPAQADALSTALFVLGADEGLALAASLEDVYAIFIMKDMSLRCSEGLEDVFAMEMLKEGAL